MPLYEYACPGCGSTFERLRKHAERDHAIACPACSAAARPVFSAAAVHGSAVASGAPHRPAGGACCGGGCGLGPT